MANIIPAGLRYTDIGLFAMRAAQIEKTKPVIAYWCNFHIVNQIIGRGLHNSNDETKIYTTNLVDKLEQFKSEHSGDELVVDSVAASALVERFGLEVFGRAEAAMNANKATKQTADTFQEAALFLELCQIWGPLDPEIAGRIKFAKYHAVRIVKAIKNGEDPNMTNPEPEDEGQGSVVEQPSRPRPPPKEIPEESDHLKERGLAQELCLDESLQRSPATSTSNIPSVLGNVTGSLTLTKDIGNPQPRDLKFSSTPGTTGCSSSVPNLPDIPRASSFSIADASHPSQPRAASSSVAVPAIHVPAAPPSEPPQSDDDQSISLAQKHAHWALSALTFDDVDTAIKEFKNSLRYLGAGC